MKTVLLSAGAVFLLLPPIASAASFNLTTSPLPVLLSANPGETVSTPLRVQNSGTEPIDIKVGLKKFKADGQTGKPILENRAAGDEFFDWVSFSRNSFRAEPGVWNEVTMTIRTPSDAAFGYYYAVTFAQVAGASAPGSNSANLHGATAVLVLLDVQAKGEKKQLEIVSFSADKKLYEYLPASFDVKIRNSGNIHLHPAGNIFITRGSKTIGTIDVNPASGNILPNSSRTFTPSWSDGFPVFSTKTDHGQIVSTKNGIVEKQLKWDFSKANRLRFGHYTAHLLLTYDNGVRDVPVEADVSFWVVPWKILPLILLGLTLIGIGLWTSSKSLYRKFRSKLQ